MATTFDALNAVDSRSREYERPQIEKIERVRAPRVPRATRFYKREFFIESVREFSCQTRRAGAVCPSARSLLPFRSNRFGLVRPAAAVLRSYQSVWPPAPRRSDIIASGLSSPRTNPREPCRGNSGDITRNVPHRGRRIFRPRPEINRGQALQKGHCAALGHSRSAVDHHVLVVCVKFSNWSW